MKYRVIECRADGQLSDEQKVEATTPEQAAKQVTGEKLVRGGSTGGNVRELVAKVYWEQPANGTISMVRLYRPLQLD